MKNTDIIKDLLNISRLMYVSHLKMIDEYSDLIEYRLIGNKNEWGLVMLLPVAASSFDAKLYPEAKYIVYLAASNEHLIPQLINEIPKETDLVFKIHNPKYTSIIEKHFTISLKNAYFSYTCQSPIECKFCHDIIKSSLIDEQLLPLWAKNGYSESDIKKYFAHGASSFSIYKDSKPVSTCLIFHNCYNIWELGFQPSFYSTG